MKNTIALLVLFISFLSFSFAQTDSIISSDSIYLGAKKGYPLTYKGETVSMKQLGRIFAGNPAAKTEWDIAKENQVFGTVFSLAGSIMVGWTLGRAIGGGHPNWFVTGAGAVCFIVAIPLISAVKKRTLKAVDIYNEGLYHAETRRVSINIGGSRDGLGLIMRF